METKELKQKYEECCNEYLKLFCDKHDYDYESALDSWVANEIGGVCLCGDYSVSFDDMKTDIDLDASKKDFNEYYGYALEAHESGFICPNFKNWLRGAPRLSEEQRKSIREAKNRLYEAREELKRIIDEENSKIMNGM